MKEWLLAFGTWPMADVLAYGLGAVGVIVEWRAYCLASAKDFRRWSAAGAILWAMQYGLLEAWTAGLTMACTALRTLLSDVGLAGKHRLRTVLVFTAIFVLLTVLSWQGLVSLLPVFAVLNTTWALFYLDNRWMRLTLLASSAAWISNDLYWHAWPALLAESVAVLINLHTLRRLFRDTGSS